MCDLSQIPITKTKCSTKAETQSRISKSKKQPKVVESSCIIVSQRKSSKLRLIATLPSAISHAQLPSSSSRPISSSDIEHTLPQLRMHIQIHRMLLRIPSDALITWERSVDMSNIMPGTIGSEISVVGGWCIDRQTGWRVGRGSRGNSSVGEC